MPSVWRHRLLLWHARDLLWLCAAPVLCTEGGREVSQAQEGCPDRWKPNRCLRVPKDICWLWKAELFQSEGEHSHVVSVPEHVQLAGLLPLGAHGSWPTPSCEGTSRQGWRVLSVVGTG